MNACKGFNLIFLDDEAVCGLLNDHFPHLSPWYEKIKVPAARADLGRLIGLYAHGGFYSDISMAWKCSFSSLVQKKHKLMLVCRDDSPTFRGLSQDMKPVINGIIGAEPQSDFILEYIKHIYFLMYSGAFNYVIGPLTGPPLVTEVYFKMRNQLGDDLILRNYTELHEHCFERRRNKNFNGAYWWQQRQGLVDRKNFSHIELIQSLWENNVIQKTSEKLDAS